MAVGLGLYSKAAFIKDPGLAVGDGTYPDTPGASDMSASHLVPFASEGVVQNIDRTLDPALDGSGSSTPSEVTGRKSSGPFGGRWRWRGWERLITCALGFEQPDDSPAQIVVGAECHLWELDDDLFDQAWIATEERLPGFSADDRKIRRGQLGIRKSFDPDWNWYSSMISKFTLSGTPQEVNGAFEVIPYSKLRGAYNSANWTYPTGTEAQVLFQQCEVKLGLRSVGEGSLTTVSPSAFELTVDNVLEGETQTTESGEYIEQPVRTDFRQVLLSLDFARYTDTEETLLLDSLDVDAEMACKLTFTGPIITGATPYFWGFFMSSLRVVSNDFATGGPGPIEPKIQFVAHKPGGSDIFETGNYNSIGLKKDSELVVTCHNEDTFNYLTET